jgi:DMSO/TMAO reductase YedYZ molybdopterin-dependent catalytic subunit
VLLADILQESGVRWRADQVFTTSIDGWTCGSPTAVLTDPGRQAMLVIRMNGEPLPIEHGFPVRMIVPGLYGFVSGTKWITDMELTTFDTKRAYRLQRGWCSGPRSRRCPVSTVPARSDGSTRTLQSQVLHGRRQRASRRSRYALTAASGDPRSYPLRSTWTPGGCSGCGGRWEPGNHVAEVRATDKTGYTQTTDRAAPIPDGASGWHSVQFTLLPQRKPEPAAADHRSNEKRAGYSTSVSNS